MQINSINSQYNINKRNISNNKSKSVAFGGFTDNINNKIGSKLIDVYTSLSNKKPVQNYIKKFSQYDSFKHLIAGESFLLSGCYMFNTAINDKIEDKQKPQMIINDALTLVISTLGAYFAEDKISAIIDDKADNYVRKHENFYIERGKEELKKAEKTPLDVILDKTKDVFGKTGDELENGINDIYKTMNDDKHLGIITSSHKKLRIFERSKEEMTKIQQDVAKSIKTSATADEAVQKVKELTGKLYEDAAAKKEVKDMLSGVRKLKLLVLFGLIYRFIAPVFVTPVANKLSSRFFPSKQEEKKSTANRVAA